MPDKYGFDHLLHHGVIAHRCIEEGCKFPEGERVMSESKRAAHQRQHERDRAAQAERSRKRNLALARRLKAQAERENARVYQ